MRKLLIGSVCVLMNVGMLMYGFGSNAEAQTKADLKKIPRNRTLITTGWDFYSQVPSPDNFNPYAGPTLHERNNLHYTVYENLFYSSLTSGQVEPWLAESYEYNGDFTQVTVKLRQDVYWSDGEQFTAEDVVFTGNILLENAPEMTYSGTFKNYVNEVVAPDPFTVIFTLNAPFPRWARDELAYNLGQPARFVIVPEHIWKDKNPLEFTNFDIEKGWPVGTGPYSIVYASSDSVMFDLREEWWADKAGKQAMPKVERIVYVPATVDAMAQLYISNQIDIGRALPVGTFEAAKAQNPSLISWNAEGPIWGAEDGCTFRVAFNNQNPTFSDPDLHWAINYALDRKQIVNLAYEGSMKTAVVPLSSYGGLKAYKEKLTDDLGQFDIDVHDIAKTAELLESKGYSKNSDGMWVDADGNVLEINIQSQGENPAGPVIVQQLKNAGFDARLEVLQNSAFIDNARTGNFESHLWVHCGSAYDPYQTLEHYHSKYAVAAGEVVPSMRAYTRYSNPELDALLDKMIAMVPSADDPTYLQLVGDALKIYLTDLPDITFGEELHVLPFNTTYWTGWASADDPYMHPYIPWEGYARIIHRLQPVQ